MWVVKIMVPFWVLSIIRHLVFRDPKGHHSFDNHPCNKTQPFGILAEVVQDIMYFWGPGIVDNQCQQTSGTQPAITILEL